MFNIFKPLVVVQVWWYQYNILKVNQLVASCRSYALICAIWWPRSTGGPDRPGLTYLPIEFGDACRTDIAGLSRECILSGTNPTWELVPLQLYCNRNASLDNFFCANPITLLPAAAYNRENQFDPDSILGRAGQAHQATRHWPAQFLDPTLIESSPHIV